MGKKKGRGITSGPPKKQGLPKQGNRPFLNPRESRVINQRINQDLRLGRQGGKKLKDVKQQFDQQIDWNALPQAPQSIDWSQAPEAPVSGDFGQWREDQINQTYKTFTDRMEPEFKAELEDFEQMAANRGWVPGSQVYNAEKTRIQQRQDDSKQQALTQAQGIAGQNAGQFFDIGSRARGQARQDLAQEYGFGRQYRGDVLGDIQQQRYNPLQEYQMLMGAQSGYGPMNQQYSQNSQLAQRNAAAQMAQAMAMKPPAFGGFGSPEAEAAFNENAYRDRQQWIWNNQPQQGQGGGASPWAQLGGNILGNAIGGWAQSGFQF